MQLHVLVTLFSIDRQKRFADFAMDSELVGRAQGGVLAALERKITSSDCSAQLAA